MACQGKKRARASDVSSKKSCPAKKKSFSALPLLDAAAKYAAAQFPYQYIEERLHNNVPEPVLKRISFWAFPTDEKIVLRYSSSAVGNLASECSKQPFQAGVKILEDGGVSDVVQIGFHLSGVVRETTGICHQKKTCSYKVSVTFDRGCITSTACACGSRSILWCAHVVALTLWRIRHADDVPIKAPISDAIFVLKKSQLQRLVLHLVASHHNEVLPYVQQLVEELVQADSDVSVMQGVPDPTAGACVDAETTWFIDTDTIRQEAKLGLMAGSSGRSIAGLLSKVREMITANDPNYINLAIAITDAIMAEFAENPNHHHNSRARKQCDSLVSLWLSIVANPNKTQEEIIMFRTHLEKWNRLVHCPKENVDDPAGCRSMFSIVDEACACVNTDSADNLYIQAGRIDWLRLCGRQQDAIDLSLRLHSDLRSKYLNRTCVYSADRSRGGLLSHATEPVHAIYNSLVESGRVVEGLEAALIGISETFSLPLGSYAQERSLHRIEQLLAQFESLDISANVDLGRLVIAYSRMFYEKWSCEKNGDHDLLPPHSFVRFVFQTVHAEDPEFAFRFALFALPLNLSTTVMNPDESSDDVLNANDDGLFVDGVECLTRSQLESRQAELAAVLLKGCSITRNFLKSTLDCVLEHICRPVHLLRLARLCQSLASSQGGVFQRNLMEVSFELGVKAIRLLGDPIERKDCIQWLVACAADTGKRAMEYLIRNWSDLFLPSEVSCDVARMLTSQPAVFRLNLSADERGELLGKVRGMVIEASIRDPASCAMFALRLCEDHLESFHLVCHIVTQSGNRLYAAQLFAIARYLEAKKLVELAFKTGLTALKQLDIGPTDEKHPAVCDVLWICTLASSMGMDELTQLAPVVVNCVRNPMILSEIASRCSSSALSKGERKFSCNKEPLNRLVASAHQLFVQDIEQRLQSITPKCYAEFTDHLRKIQLAFALTDDGNEQFSVLVDFILESQRGKKKLRKLVHQAISQRTSNMEPNL